MTNNVSVSKTAELTKMALIIAMNCVSAYIIIPLPFSLSPISLQTMLVNLTGYVLNTKQAFLAFLTYILVGLAGVPVFTGGTAGPAKLFGPTGGYIIGFFFTAVFLAATRGEKYNFTRYALLGCLVGIPIIYLFGFLQLKLVTGMPWDKAFYTGVLPFIPLDIAKCAAAAFLAGPIHRAFGNK
jgi:biotin transport system substrate-specific component